jgi:hypothetical protein
MQTVTLQVEDELITPPTPAQKKKTFSRGNVVPSVYPNKPKLHVMFLWQPWSHDTFLNVWKPGTKTTQNKMALGRPSLAYFTSQHKNVDIPHPSNILTIAY